MGCVHAGDSRESEAQDRSNLAGLIVHIVLSQYVFLEPKWFKRAPLDQQLACKGAEMGTSIE